MSVLKIFHALFLVIGSTLLFTIGCGRELSSNPESGDLGFLSVNAQFAQSALMKTDGVTQTIADSLIIEVSASDFQLIRKAVKLTGTTPLVNDTLTSIPTGENRVVRIWTKDKTGQLLHQDSLVSQTVRITANTVTQVYARLKPGAGSFYLQIANVPDTVDSIVAVFTSSNKTWTSQVKRSLKVLLSLDNIPNNTSGILSVYGVSVLKDTLYRASTQVTYLLNNTSIVNLSFHTLPGALAMNVSITLAPSTIVSANMGAYTSDTVETGDVFITEIMYASNDSEYIEIYNPSDISASYDTLFIDIDGDMRAVTNVIIGAKGYFTIGRRVLPWVNTSMSVVSFLDLTQNGNWITLRSKTKKMIDRVAFSGVTNTLEWPTVSGKRSIILAQNGYSAQLNNYGRNWTGADILIPGTTTQYGTPGL